LSSFAIYFNLVYANDNGPTNTKSEFGIYFVSRGVYYLIWLFFDNLRDFIEVVSEPPVEATFTGLFNYFKDIEALRLAEEFEFDLETL